MYSVFQIKLALQTERSKDRMHAGTSPSCSTDLLSKIKIDVLRFVMSDLRYVNVCMHRFSYRQATHAVLETGNNYYDEFGTLM